MQEGEWTRRRWLGAVSTVGTVTIAGCGSLASGDGTPTPKGEPTVATEAARQIEEWRQSRRDTTRRLSRSEVIRSGTQSERQAFLEDEYERLPDDVIKIQIVNRSSTTVTASSDTTRIGDPQLTRESPWRNAELSYGADGVYIAEATNALETSLVSFVTPIEIASGESHVLVMQTDFEALAGTLPAPDDGFTQVVDSEGRIVGGFQNKLAANRWAFPEYTRYPDELSILQDGLAGESGVVLGYAVNENTAVDLEEFVVGFAPVDGGEWVAFTHEPVGTDDGLF